MAEVQLVTAVVSLTVEGQEVFLKGGVEALWPWHFGVSLPETPYGAEAPDSSIALETVLLSMPDKQECLTKVLEKLKAKEKEIQAQAYVEMKEVNDRRNDLLMLGHSEPTE